MGSENKKLRQYLLNSLTQNEMEEFDLQIITDPQMEELLHFEENALTEDYLENNLSAEEIRNFETHFLACDDRVKDIELLNLLKMYANRKAAAVPVPPKKEKLPFSVQFKKIFKDFRVPIAAAAAVLLLSLGLFTYWQIMNMNPLDQAMSDQVAQLNREDLSDLNKVKDLSRLNLIQGSFRGGEGTDTLDGEGITAKILLRLGLPADVQTKTAFTVKLFKSDTLMLTLPSQSSYSNPNGQEMRLLFPREVLRRGSYRIELQKGTEVPISYSFKVE